MICFEGHLITNNEQPTIRIELEKLTTKQVIKSYSIQSLLIVVAEKCAVFILLLLQQICFI